MLWHSLQAHCWLSQSLLNSHNHVHKNFVLTEGKCFKEQLSEVLCSFYDSAVSSSSTCSAWLTGAGEKQNNSGFFLFYFIPCHSTVETVPHKGFIVRQRVTLYLPGFLVFAFDLKGKLFRVCMKFCLPAGQWESSYWLYWSYNFTEGFRLALTRRPIVGCSPKCLPCLC